MTRAKTVMRTGFVLPLPRILLHPLTAVIVAILHVYLAAGHLAELAAGRAEWTHVWKGFGALAGAYVFAALASRTARRSSGERLPAAEPDGTG